MSKISVILLLVFVSFIEAAKILAVWPVVSRTHFTLGMSLFEELADRGHEITLISPYNQRETHVNIKMIKLTGATEAAMERHKMTFEELRNLSVIEQLREKIDAGAFMVDFALEHEAMKGILKSEEKFDLFMYDAFYNDVLLVIPHYLNIPAIAFSTVGVNQQTNEMTRTYQNPAVVPNSLLDLHGNMSFIERIRNTAVTLTELYFYHFNYLPRQNALIKKHFDEAVLGSLPNLIDLIHNVNLVLLNTHSLIQPSYALPPSSIEVGGMQVKAKMDEIHPELEAMLERAKFGIVYVSLGGTFKSSDLPSHHLDTFINVFASLKPLDIVVLWKFETIDLKERHAHNIVVGPWMPQQEILAHKNLRAFITHGGLLSLTESIHYGKPVVGLPILSDQKSNMAQAERLGYGLRLDFDTLSESTLRAAIDALFNDTSFAESAAKISANMKAAPVRAVDRAAGSVEHVLKTGRNFRSAATNLSFLQLLLLDQILAVAALIASIIVTLRGVRRKFQKRTKSAPRAAASAAVRKSKFKSN